MKIVDLLTVAAVLLKINSLHQLYMMTTVEATIFKSTAATVNKSGQKPTNQFVEFRLSLSSKAINHTFIYS